MFKKKLSKIKKSAIKNDKNSAIKKKIKLNKSNLSKTEMLRGKLLHILKLITDEQYLSEMTYGRLSRFVINIVKVFITSIRKFMEDDCLTKATAITYTTLMSIIPTLAVVLTFVSIFKGVGAQKDQIFGEIAGFLAEHNLQRLNITPLFNVISQLLDNAKSIGIVGTIVLVFSATAVLRTLEQALNKIWKIKKQRPFFIKIIYYWSALTLGPLMLFAGATVATQVSAAFSTSDYNAALESSGKTWIVGSKATIGFRRSILNKTELTPINSIDFQNQRIYTFRNDVGVFSEDPLNLIDTSKFRKSVFNDINIKGKNIWVVGKDGIILRSIDNGKSWKIEKFANFNFHQIYMHDELSGIIISDQGTILNTEDGGYTWIVSSIKDINVNLKKVIFQGDYGIIIADKGYIIETYDRGLSWSSRQLSNARIGNNYVSLNSISINNNNILIGGDEGVLLLSQNRGRSFEKRTFRADDYSAVVFENKDRYYAGTTKGKVIFTNDNGKNWQIISGNGNKINTMFAAADKITLIGNTGMVLYSSDNGFIWQGKTGKSIIFYILNFFAPFAVIWLLFLLMYMVLPNIRIPFRSAALGASFTGSVWVAFIYIFIVYVKSFANGTFAIYGALAAFPLILLLIYASNVITLFGAELSYTLMFPSTYKNLKRKIAIRDYVQIINGIRILFLIYSKFEDGKGGSSHQDILTLCSNNITETDFYLDLFKENELIAATEGLYTPTTASTKIVVSDVVAIINNFTMDSSNTTSDPVKKILGKKFQKMHNSFRTILGKDTLADIIRAK